MIHKKSINRVILVGHIGNNPETRYTKEGRAVSSFSLATHEYHRASSEKEAERTEWHNILAWGKVGEFADQYIKKGHLVCIEGRLKTSKWSSKEGVPLSKTEIVASTITPLEWKS